MLLLAEVVKVLLIMLIFIMKLHQAVRCDSITHTDLVLSSVFTAGYEFAVTFGLDGSLTKCPPSFFCFMGLVLY